MYHADQGAAFAAEALTDLRAAAGLPAVDPRASPAGEAAGGGDFVPETGDQEEAGDQETQGATQGTAPAAAQAAVQPYETGDEVGMAIHRGLGFGEGTANYSDDVIRERLTQCLIIAQRLAATPATVVIGDEQPRVLQLAQRVADSFAGWEELDDERREGDVGLGGDGPVSARDRSAMTIMPGCQHHDLSNQLAQGPWCYDQA